MIWTDEQKAAIEYRGGSAIVSAAAGSGKTAVLVERVIQLLKDEENPVKADELVVATFTEKAAGELTVRLNKALTAAIEENPENDYLKMQLLRLEDASISTISSFCLGILRRNGAAMGISPDFSVIDEAEAVLLRKRALDTVLERFYSEAENSEKELLFSWYGGENDSQLETIITKLYNFSRNLPDSESSFAMWLDHYEHPENIPGELTEGCLRRVCGTNISAMNEIITEISEKGCEKETEYAAAWARCINELLSCIEAKSYTYNIELPALPRKKKDFDNTILKEKREILVEYWNAVTETLSLVSRLEDDCKECAPVLKLLLSLTAELTEEFNSLKRSKEKVDFSDIELMTLKLLKDEKTAEAIRSCISVIIVDEFQDSNEIQYEIFRRISRGGNNLYFVGDIKQSIYRFRGADPRVFMRIMEDGSFHKILLNNNFRSSAPVIDSVNALFEGTMTKRLGGVDYGEDTRLRQGRPYETDERFKTELIIIDGKKAEETRKSEAQYITDRIRDMVESGFPVTDGEIRRPCRYGDFAVLMGRYSASAYIYKNAFAEAGIPFEAKDEGGYTDFSEVRFALSLLRVIDNPYRDSDLAAVLTLPPYSFTADELAEAKLGGGEIRFRNLYSGLKRLAETNDKAKRFCEDLGALRAYSSEQPVERLVRKIYDESGLAEAMRALPDGEKKDANLKLLISYAKRFSENGSDGLYGFLEYMDNIRKKQVSLTQAQSAAASENSVRIMTIHGSKGLEFPICFVSNLASAFRKGETGPVNTESEQGIGLKIIDRENMLIIPTFINKMIEEMNSMLEQSEEMRLLYVAATRAREKLIFTCPLTERQQRPGAHLGWILESGAVRKGLISVEHISEYKSEKREKDCHIAEELPELLPFKEYEYIRYSEIPSKVTATQVGVKSVDDFSEYTDRIDRFLRVPSFIQEDAPKKLSGKKKGDAYHKFMEMVDFSGDAKQLDKFYENGKLTELERNSINDGEIEAFLNSSLCERLRKSDRIYREFPIFCEYCPEDFPENEEKPFIQGIADLYFIENSEIVLVDYKTNSRTTPEQLREEYEGQLRVYKEALERMTGLNVKECLIYSFTLCKEISV